MNKNSFGKSYSVILMVLLLTAAAATGCGRQTQQTTGTTVKSGVSVAVEDTTGNTDRLEAEGNGSATETLEVRFGDEGTPFLLNLEDNETAAAISKYVGTSDWRLPIYHYDDYENWEVMQYYDIPSRYEIPSVAKTVTAQKAGEVYYSEPNRILLFYQDAEVTGEFTKIGSIEDTDTFREAVAKNPVLEGWGNKIVLINSVK